MVKVTTLEAELLGVTETHVQGCCAYLSEGNHGDAPTVPIHQQVVAPLQQLQADAYQAGFTLAVASGFRSFARQLSIWNRKCAAQQPLLDEYGAPMGIFSLSAYEKLGAILRWSALPGASRHHWGTECDIYDVAAIEPDYKLQLIPEEYQGNGPFAPMMEWLAEYLQQTDSPTFYRPYHLDHQGVAPEPWHISYRPLAEHYEKAFSLLTLKRWLQANPIHEKEAIFDHLDEIYSRFICLPDSYYSATVE